MLKVPQQQYIRFLREAEGCSIQEIVERVGVNWRTAKKYADQDDWNESVAKRKGAFPVLGPYLDAVDTWLEEDERMPRKQRHTARHIFHRLRDEYGFTGGERTVSQYVSKRRKQMVLERSERFERLEHPGGEAQADFGTVHIVKSGELVERKVLTVSFPSSNAAFVFPVPKENTECFLEALKRVFEQVGGVPRKIWFDNLSAAVVSVLADGERKTTDAFARFCAHYRFEPLFCNPRSGNEKGNVENKVGYGRRNWCVPPPVVETAEEFEAHLAQAAKLDMQRPHYAKQARIVDLWEQEQQKLLHLPTVPFEVFRIENARLNKYSELQFESTRFPLPQCNALLPVLLKVKWDEMEVLSADGMYQRLATLPRPYTEKAMPLDWRSIFAGYRKRPRSVMYSTFVDMMPQPVRELIQEEDAALRKSRIEWVHRLLDTYSLNEINDGLVQAKASGDHGRTELECVLYAMRHPEFHPEPFAEPHTPDCVRGHLPQLDAYDRLLGVTVDA
ncbi:IS21 family transposase [Alicyclobacillus fodiniaquatilis]|uniref:IS21 family transposase n=1 Tax=Alicyclobacillus fodiniaquatilis TaxID=1661150 RepID=A0ABW4JK28_9BACL